MGGRFHRGQNPGGGIRLNRLQVPRDPRRIDRTADDLLDGSAALAGARCFDAFSEAIESARSNLDLHK